MATDLYRIDLQEVVSRYVGETERNLDRVFTAAKGSKAVLFFDEADALFGERTNVKDSHDRYANIEINNLMHKIEAYSGVAILFTKRRGNIDKAFARRFKFVVSVPPKRKPHRRERR